MSLRYVHILVCTMLLTTAAGNGLFSQNNISLTIPPLTRVDLEPSATSFTLQLNPPSAAGSNLTVGSSATNNTKWLNYTCAIQTGGTSKRILVQVTNGAVPTGTTLSVTASAYSGSGAGTMGVSAGPVSLSYTAKELISGIGRSFTGDGSSNGHRLTYTLAIEDIVFLNFRASGSLQITYTISD